MIKSMTGYGRAALDNPPFHFECEIRSTNHRFCEISLRLPITLNPLDGLIRTLVQKRIARGKVSVIVTFTALQEQTITFLLNEEVVACYQNIIDQLRSRFNVSDSLNLDTLLSVPDLIQRNTLNMDLEAMGSALEAVVNAALDNLEVMQKNEGEYLANDLRQRITKMDAMLDEIESLAAARMNAAYQKMRDRIQQILGDISVDENRVAMEIALMADKLDITEECTRFRSHNHQFVNYLADSEPTGRRFNFLLQELNREANTIASKANHFEIAQHVVIIKDEIEKIREQIQNVE